MQQFACFVLIAIIIASAHVYNWIIRKLYGVKDGEGAIFFVSLVYFLINCFTFYYLVIWLYPLLRK